MKDYLLQLGRIPVNKKGSHRAPHKAVLLLAICDLIETGVITSNFIPLNDNLNRTFNARWKKHVPITSPFTRRIAYPFYHLSSSDFWHLVITPSYTENKQYSSMGALKKDFAGATIDLELFKLIKNPDSRQQIKQVLIATYLSEEGINLSNSSSLTLVPIVLLLCAVA